MKNLILLSLILVQTISLSAQSLQDIIYAIDNIIYVDYSVECRIENKVKNWEEGYIENHHIFFSGGDTLYRAYFNFQKQNRTHIYNGKEIIILDDKTNNATIVDLNSYRHWFENRYYENGSIIEIRNLLKRIRNNPNCTVTYERNKLGILCNDYDYKASLVEKMGYHTKINISVLSGFNLPERIEIITFLEQEVIESRELVFSNISLSDYPELSLFTQEFIDRKYDLVLHRPINDIKTGELLPNWSVYPFQSKNKILISELTSNSVLLIEFWFTQCPPCIKSIPILKKLNEEFVDPELKVLYINPLPSESDEAISSFREKHDVKFDIYRFGNIFDKGSLPTFMLIDKDGTVLYTRNGFSESLFEDISNLLKKNTKQTPKG